MGAGGRIDHLRGDAHPIATLAHRSFEHIAHTQFARHLLHSDCLALVGEGRVASDHKQPANAAQFGDNILNHAIGEIFLLGITTQVLEWQYRDRGLVRQGERRPFPWRAPANRYAIDAHRTRNVLELLHAHILEVDGELVAHLLIGRVRDADAAGLRYTF